MGQTKALTLEPRQEQSVMQITAAEIGEEQNVIHLEGDMGAYGKVYSTLIFKFNADRSGGTYTAQGRGFVDENTMLGGAGVGVWKREGSKAYLEEVVNIQQSASKEVVEGLRRQMKEMKAALVEKDRNYVALEARTAQLNQQLGEARDQIRDLRGERDALLVERDQMSALLKLNESERVQLLIKQNMEMGRSLNTARERLKALHSDNNATKDQLSDADVKKLQDECSRHKAYHPPPGTPPTSSTPCAAASPRRAPSWAALGATTRPAAAAGTRARPTRGGCTPTA